MRLRTPRPPATGGRPRRHPIPSHVSRSAESVLAPARWQAVSWRTGTRKYYLTNHPANTALRTLAATIKARWVCEQAHQQLKEELGLDHFEGRSWLGLHHHALFTMLAFTFLQHHRQRTLAGRGKKNSGRRAATPANTPRGPARAPRRPDPAGPAALSRLSRARHVSPETIEDVAK